MIAGSLALMVPLAFGVAKVFAGPPPPCSPIGPTNTSPPVMSPTGNGKTGTLLTITSDGSWTPHCIPIDSAYTTYSWLRDGTAISGHTGTGSTYKTYTTSSADIGHTIVAEVIECDTNDTCNGANSSGSYYVSPPPTATTPPTITPSGTGQTTGTSYDLSTLAAWSSAISITGYQYQWAQNGTRFGTVSASHQPYLSACSTDAGTTLTLQVRAENADGWSNWSVSSNNAQFVPCNTAAPTFSPSGTGQTADGSQQFTAVHGTWVGATSYTYQWLSNGSPASGSGAGTATYTPSCTADAGATLTVEVKATNAYGTSAYVLSLNNAQFVPCNTSVSTITPSGTGRTVGEPLTTTDGSWSGSVSLSYAWLRDGTPISGAGSSGYTTTAADIGHCITSQVTATNSYGSASETSSNSACYDPNDPTNLVPVDGRIANNDTPSLSSTFSDPNGQSGYVTYTIKTLGGTTVASGSSATVSSGSTASWTVPAGGLSPGTTYHWYAEAFGSTAGHSNDRGPFTYTDQYRLGTASYYTYAAQQAINDQESLSVNVGNGNLVLSANDVQLPGVAGFDLNFDRTYNSLYSASQDLASPMPANGWETLASLGVFSDGDVRYASASGLEYNFNKNSDGSYTTPAGADATLVQQGDGSYVLTFDGSGAQQDFTSAGQLTAYKDQNSNTIAFSWNSGKLSSITDSTGKTTTFTYNGSGRLTTIAAPGTCDAVSETCTYQYGYDGSGNLSSYTDPNSKTTDYAYNGAGLLSQVTDSLGNATAISYDSSNRVSSIQTGLASDGSCTSGNCPLTSFSYDSGDSFCTSGSSTDVLAPDQLLSGGNPTRYCFDSLLRVTGVEAPDGSTTYTDYHDDNGGSGCTDNVLCSTTDALGNKTTYSYDATYPQDLLSVVQPSGATTSTVYDSADNHPYYPKTVTSPPDANGKYTITTYAYDAAGNQLTTTTATYNASHTLLSTIVQGRYAYDSAGSETAVTDANGYTTQSIYDSNGHLTCLQSGLTAGSGSGAYVCGVGDNATLEPYYCPSGETCPTTTYSYDAAGNQVSVTGPDGFTTQSIFDANGRLTCSQGGLTAGSSGGAFECGVGNVSSKAFYCASGDACPTTTYSYDANGNQTAITDPDGFTTQSIYDANNQLTCSQSGLSAGSGSGIPIECPVGDDSTQPYYCPSGRTCPTTTYGYDANGNQASVTDPNGHTTQSIYDSNNQLTCSQSGLTAGSSGGAFECGVGNDSSKAFYCASGDACPTTTYSYDANGNQTAITDPDGFTTQSIYDANNQLTCSQSGLSAGSGSGIPIECPVGDDSTQPYYCPSGRTCPTTTFGYDANGNRVSVTDPDGFTTQSIYDGNGELTCTQGGLSAGASGGAFVCGVGNDSSKAFYCASGNTCPTTSYTYDQNGNRVAVTGSDGFTTQSIYDGNGRLTCSQSGLSAGTPTGAFVCGVGNDSSKAFYCPSGQTCPTTTYGYDANGNRVSVTDPDGFTTQSIYDGNGALTCSQGGLSAGASGGAFVCGVGNDSSKAFYCPSTKTCPTTTYGYDANGNQVSVTGPDGYTTQSIYDSNNQLTCSQSGLSAGTTGAAFACGVGNDSSKAFYCSSGPPGRTCPTTTYSYDSAGNQVSDTGPDGFTTQSIYNSNNQLTCSQTGLSGGTSGGGFVCGVGNDSSKAFYCPSTQTCSTTTYAYDNAGNQIAATDPNGYTTQSIFDNNEQMACSQSGLSTGVSGGAFVCGVGNDSSKAFYCPSGQTCPTTTYTYDADGNKTTITEPSTATVTHGYDNNDRLTTTSYSDSTPTVTYTYYAFGNRSSMSDGAGTITYTYNNNERLLSSTRGSDTFSYTYDPNGNISSRAYPDGTSASYLYDNNENLSTVTSGGNTTTYTYYPAGSVHTKTLPNGYVETSTYDNVGRRTEVTNAKSGNTLSDYAYTYDAANNPTEVVQSGAVTSTTLYQYDNKGQLVDACYQATACNETAGSSDPYIRYTYDGDGNRLTEARPAGTTTSNYNNIDELTSAGSTNYTYDANGNEHSVGSQTFNYNAANQLTSTTSSGTTTTYTYDGDGNRLSESTGGSTTNYLWDSNGTMPQLALERDGSGTVLRSYVYGNERVSMNSGGNAYYYLYDSPGSVVNLTSAAGTTEWTYSYDPFGGVRTQTQNDPSAPANPMQYSGQILDAPSGLYDLRARQYDANTGRFLSQDPAANAGQTAGTYIYANDNPNIYTDPTGTCYRSNGDSDTFAVTSKTNGSFDPSAFGDNARVKGPQAPLCNYVNHLWFHCDQAWSIWHDTHNSPYDPLMLAGDCWDHVNTKLRSQYPNLWHADPLRSETWNFSGWIHSAGDFIARHKVDIAIGIACVALAEVPGADEALIEAEAAQYGGEGAAALQALGRTGAEAAQEQLSIASDQVSTVRYELQNAVEGTADAKAAAWKVLGNRARIAIVDATNEAANEIASNGGDPFDKLTQAKVAKAFVETFFRGWVNGG